MAHFLFKWRYKDSAIKAMPEMPQDRPSELRKAVEGFGGKVLQFFSAFGADGGIAIVEFPDNESCRRMQPYPRWRRRCRDLVNNHSAFGRRGPSRDEKGERGKNRLPSTRRLLEPRLSEGPLFL